MNKPREHHYSFVHQKLPELTFKFRDSFLSLLRKSGNGYLKGVWYRLGATLPRDKRLAMDGLTLTFIEDERFCGVVIKLPVALHRTEAHMVTLLAERVCGSILADDNPGFEYRNLRYFTLERGRETPGVAATVLGEWAIHRHCNYGPGPTVGAKLFWEACRVLSASQKRHKDAEDSHSRGRHNHRNDGCSTDTHKRENLLRFCHPAFWALEV